MNNNNNSDINPFAHQSVTEEKLETLYWFTRLCPPDVTYCVLGSFYVRVGVYAPIGFTRVPMSVRASVCTSIRECVVTRY